MVAVVVELQVAAVVQAVVALVLVQEFQELLIEAVAVEVQVVALVELEVQEL